MSMLYLTGSRMNILAANGAGASPAAEAWAPVTNAYDGEPATRMVFSAVSAGSHIRAVSLNRLTNAGFETAGPSGWTDQSVGGGSATRVNTAGHARTGTWALDLVGVSGAEPGRRMQDITVSAGEYGRLSAWMRITSGGATNPYFIIYNKKTGKYWNGSTWGGSFAGVPIPTASLNGATHTFVSATFQVESYDACREDTVTLSVGFHNELGTVAVDDALYVPGVNFGGIFGHNIGPAVPEFSSSDDDVSFTVRSTPTVRRGAFFGKWSTVYAEFWLAPVFTGTNHEAPYFGEVILGQYQTCETSPLWDFSDKMNIPGVRTVGPSGKVFTYNFASDPTTDLELQFSPRSAADIRELGQALWLRSAQGRYPTIIIPIDSEEDIYIGHLQDPFSRSRPFMGVHDVPSLKLTGAPLPLAGA